MAVHNLEITTENLLDVVVQMPKSEFNRFVGTARELRNKQESAVSPKETDLLLKINTLFSIDERKGYNELYAKFQEDKLNEAKHRELLELSDKFELLNAKRLEYLGELA